MTTKEFMKAMEKGELLAADVMPKVAKQMAIAARKGGALTASLNSNRVAMGQMTTEWKELANIFFTSGVNDQLTAMFHMFTNLAVIVKPLANIIGGGLATAFNILSAPLRIVVAGIADLVELFGGNVDKDIGNVVAKILELVVALYALKTAWGFIKKGGKVIGAIKDKVGAGAGATEKLSGAKVGAGATGGISKLGIFGRLLGGAGMAYSAYEHKPWFMDNPLDQYDKMYKGSTAKTAASAQPTMKVDFTFDKDSVIRISKMEAENMLVDAIVNPIQTHTGK